MITQLFPALQSFLTTLVYTHKAHGMYHFEVVIYNFLPEKKNMTEY